MKRRTFAKQGLLASAGLAINPWLFPKSPATSLSKRKDLPLPVLRGTPRQRGQIHGEALKSKIAELVGIWKEQLGESTRKNPDTYLQEFMENTSFTKSIETWTPDLLEEVKGISEGSGLDFITALSYQLMDEEWWYRRNQSCGMTLPLSRNCTALGVCDQEGSPVLLGQNMDIPQWTDGYQVLLRIRDEQADFETLVFSYAGLIVLNGLNSRAIGLCCNTVLQSGVWPFYRSLRGQV